MVLKSAMLDAVTWMVLKNSSLRSISLMKSALLVFEISAEKKPFGACVRVTGAWTS